MSTCGNSKSCLQSGEVRIQVGFNKWNVIEKDVGFLILNSREENFQVKEEGLKYIKNILNSKENILQGGMSQLCICAALDLPQICPINVMLDCTWLEAMFQRRVEKRRT